MKTAMQELMGFVNSFQEETIHPRILRVKIKELLEKEKEQIINFAYEILETSDEHQSGYVSIEEIYNQTYNQNK